MDTTDRLAAGAFIVSVISLGISVYSAFVAKRAHEAAERAETAHPRVADTDGARERDRQGGKRRADLRAEIMASTLFVRNFGEAEATEIAISLTCGDRATDIILFRDVRPPDRIAAGGAVSFHLGTFDGMPRRYDARLTWKNAVHGDPGLWESALTRGP